MTVLLGKYLLCCNARGVYFGELESMLCSILMILTTAVIDPLHFLYHCRLCIPPSLETGTTDRLNDFSNVSHEFQTQIDA